MAYEAADVVQQLMDNIVTKTRENVEHAATIRTMEAEGKHNDAMIAGLGVALLQNKFKEGDQIVGLRRKIEQQRRVIAAQTDALRRYAAAYGKVPDSAAKPAAEAPAAEKQA